MNDPISDEDIKGLFARQRLADDERVPGFHAMRARALAAGALASPVRPSPWRWALAGAVAFCLVLTAVLSHHHATTSPATSGAALAREFDEFNAELQKSLTAQNTLTAWQPPTDFLLTPTHNENTP